ncbi:TlpA family protein disulfide reductase [Taibaiella koreensis]|uniref:TlpA family protein disulfide reductase n=1 Tax=Taibaiella koreensis TaxID=1268548 RepID=UPI000E59DA28|nr:TlpA disulfide reductase family protein [Taibaiella koreensis]
MKDINLSYSRLHVVALCLLFFLSGLPDVHAQVKAIRQDEAIGNFGIGHFLNQPEKKMQSAQLKGKVLLFDFFSIWCTSCIAAMPRMDSLQKEFGNKIQIILVTRNTDKEVNKLFDRIKLRIPNLAVITQDTLLNKLFPHYGEPHHVWIDQQGIYRLATFEYNATRQNVQDFLDRKSMKMSHKKDNIYKDAPLIEQAGTFSNLVDSYSILMRGLFEYTFDSPIIVEKDSVSGFPRAFKAVNANPLNLLQSAYNTEVYGYDYPIFGSKVNKRLIIEVNDRIALSEPRNTRQLDDWKRKNLWSYEVKVRPDSSGHLYRKMRSDLEAVLPYKGVIESRRTKCYVLIKTADSLERKGASLSSESKVLMQKGTFTLVNSSLLPFVSKLNQSDRLANPVIDQSGVTGPVDLQIKIHSLSDIEMLREELKRYGLAITEKELMIKQLVIRDK